MAEGTDGVPSRFGTTLLSLRRGVVDQLRRPGHTHLPKVRRYGQAVLRQDAAHGGTAGREDADRHTRCGARSVDAELLRVGDGSNLPRPTRLRGASLLCSVAAILAGQR